MGNAWWDPASIPKRAPSAAQLATDDATIDRLDQDHLAYTKARRVAWILHAVALMTGVWGLATVKQPTSAATWVCMALPIVGLGVARASRGSIQMDGPKRDGGQPHVAMAVMMPSLFLMGFGVMTPLLDPATIAWAGAAVVAGLFALAARRIERSLPPSTLAIVAFAGACYGWGAIVRADVLLDDSVPRVVAARVVEMHVSRARKAGTLYNLRIVTADESYAPIDATVSRREYERCKVGRPGVLRVYRGALGLRWFRFECTGTAS